MGIDIKEKISMCVCEFGIGKWKVGTSLKDQYQVI